MWCLIKTSVETISSESKARKKYGEKKKKIENWGPENTTPSYITANINLGKRHLQEGAHNNVDQENIRECTREDQTKRKWKESWEKGIEKSGVKRKKKRRKWGEMIERINQNYYLYEILWAIVFSKILLPLNREAAKNVELMPENYLINDY